MVLSHRFIYMEIFFHENVKGSLLKKKKVLKSEVISPRAARTNVPLTHFSQKLHTTTTINTSTGHTIKVHKNTLMSSREQDMSKFTPVGPDTLWLRSLS